MKIPIFAVLAALFLLDAPSVRCQAPPAAPRPKLQLRDIESMTPAARLRQAVAAGDLRFLGINEYALIVPGMTGQITNPVVKLKGYYGIEGTGDYIQSREQARLQKIARRFAPQYNRLLLAHLKAVNDIDFQRAVREIDEELLRLEHANPQIDAKAALKKGNRPVIGVEGVGSPGLVKDKDFAEWHFAQRYLKASDDLMTLTQKNRLRKIITRYVIPYNQTIQRHWNASRKKKKRG